MITTKKLSMKHSKMTITCKRKNTELKVKSSAATSRKRSASVLMEDDNQKNNKRRKMDRVVTEQCSIILKMLMNHPNGWVFNQHEEPLKLGISKKFCIISKPMDLGTIKTKLERGGYFTVDEFAADVRHTFANAMRCNPESNNIHLKATELENFFNARWTCLEAKWSPEISNSGGIVVKKTDDLRPNCQKISLKSLMSFEEKKRLKKEISDLLTRKVPLNLRRILQKLGLNFQKEETFEVDVDRLDDKTFWELKRVLNGYSAPKVAKVKTIPKGVKWQKRVSAVASDILMDNPAKNTLKSQMGKSDQGSNGLDKENVYSCQQLPTQGLKAASNEGREPLIDVQLSPKHALRAAMLKSRFANTIFKAQQETNLDRVIQGDKADMIKMQQERERPKRQQLEEKARIEAKIRAAEEASRMKRQRQREAARLALDKMENTANIYDNVWIMKEIEDLVGHSLSYSALFPSC